MSGDVFLNCSTGKLGKTIINFYQIVNFLSNLLAKREFQYQNGRAGESTSKRESPAQNGRVGTYDNFMQKSALSASEPV